MDRINGIHVTQHLAGMLLHIIGNQDDYRRRVDAISELLMAHEDLTAKTALLIALASVAPQPTQNWSTSR